MPSDFTCVVKVTWVAGSYRQQVLPRATEEGTNGLLRRLFVVCLPSRLGHTVPTTHIRILLNILSVPVRAHSQHIHLNCHLLDPASSKSHNGLFRPETSPAVPCLDALCLEPALFSPISPVLDLHMALLTAEALPSPSPRFISSNYYLKLACLLPYLLAIL